MGEVSRVKLGLRYCFYCTFEFGWVLCVFQEFDFGQFQRAACIVYIFGVHSRFTHEEQTMKHKTTVRRCLAKKESFRWNLSGMRASVVRA